jgi:hypothetical protein
MRLNDSQNSKDQACKNYKKNQHYCGKIKKILSSSVKYNDKFFKLEGGF